MAPIPDTQAQEASPIGAKESSSRSGRLARFAEFDLLGSWSSRPAWIPPLTPAALLLGAVFALGIFLRAKEFFADRSVWADEAMLSLNIARRGFAELLEPLDMGQAAPHGFLYLQKLGHMAFNSVKGVRIVPFLGSLLTLPFFYLACRRLIGARGAFFALFLLAISPLAIRHAAEAKQYGFDLLAAVMVLHAAAVYATARNRTLALIWLAVAGSVTLLLSHAVVFVTACAGLMLLAGDIVRQRRLPPGLAIVGGVVFLAAVANYMLALKPIQESKGVNPYWEQYYLPFPPQTSEEWEELAEAPELLLEDVLGVDSAGLGAAGLLLGLVALVLRRRADWAGIVALPLILLLGSAMVGAYPFHPRFLLFCIPLLALGIAAGLEGMIAASSRKFVVAGWLLAIVILGGTARGNFKSSRYWQPFQYQEIRPLMQYVQEQMQDEDLISVDWLALGSYEFHTLWDRGFEKLRDHPHMIVKERDNFSFNAFDDAGRVWVIYTHVPDRYEADKNAFLQELDRRGQRIDQRTAPTAWLYLYDLSG
jgi:hypothetical protein